MSSQEVINITDDYSPVRDGVRKRRISHSVIEIVSDEEPQDDEIFVDALNEEEFIDAELMDIIGAEHTPSVVHIESRPSARKLFVSSSPVSRSGGNDSIVDSSFSFSKNANAQVSNKASTSILDIDHWISDSDSDADEAGRGVRPIKATRAATIPVSTTTITATTHDSQRANANLDDVIYLSSPSVNSQPIPSSASKRLKRSTPIKSSSAYHKTAIPSISHPISPGASFNMSSPIPEPPIPVFLRQTSPSASAAATKKSKSKTKSQSKPTTKPIPKPKSNQNKQQINKANRVNRSKEELLSEMTLVMSSTVFPKFKSDQITNTLVPSKLETAFHDIPIIYWKRRVNASYDKNNDVFVPCEEKDILERNIVLYYSAEEFFKKVQDNVLKHDIYQAKVFYTSLKPVHQNCFITIVIESLDGFLTKIKNKEQKEYKESVIQRMNSNEVPTSQPKSRKRKAAVVDEINISSKMVEFLLQKTQIELKVVTFPVKNAPEGLMWLQSFTYTISQALYDKFERNSSLANLGTVKSGKDTKSTFMQSIQQFKLMTESKSERLYMFYGSIRAIYDRFVSHGSLGQDSSGRNIIPPSSDIAMRNFFTAKDPHAIINETT